MNAPSLRHDFYLHSLSGSPMPERKPHGGVFPQVPRSNGWRSRVIGPATAKQGSFAITVNERDTIGVIGSVDLERGAPEWNVIAGAERHRLLLRDMVTGRGRRRSCELIKSSGETLWTKLK